MDIDLDVLKPQPMLKILYQELRHLQEFQIGISYVDGLFAYQSNKLLYQEKWRRNWME